MNNNNGKSNNINNNCDHRPVSSETDRTSLSEDVTDYSTANDLENDTDTTLLCENTSALRAEANSLADINKLAVLQRTVDSLRDKLISKEKELTDLQLKQWSSDYLIDQLRLTIARLERENAQLKAVVVKSNRVNL